MTHTWRVQHGFVHGDGYVQQVKKVLTERDFSFHCFSEAGTSRRTRHIPYISTFYGIDWLEGLRDSSTMRALLLGDISRVYDELTAP